MWWAANYWSHREDFMFKRPYCGKYKNGKGWFENFQKIRKIWKYEMRTVQRKFGQLRNEEIEFNWRKERQDVLSIGVHCDWMVDLFVCLLAFKKKSKAFSKLLQSTCKACSVFYWNFRKFTPESNLSSSITNFCFYQAGLHGLNHNLQTKNQLKCIRAR